MKSSRQELQELRVEAKYLLSHDQARQLRPLLRRRLALEVEAAATAYRRSRAELRLGERNRDLASRRAELARGNAWEDTG